MIFKKYISKILNSKVLNYFKSFTFVIVVVKYITKSMNEDA